MTEQELLSLTQASARYQIPIPTLRECVQHEKIVGRKVGNQWVVTPQAVESYLANRPKRGRPPKNKG